jgi:hypothetical protein
MTKMDWTTVWGIFLQTHLVTLFLLSFHFGCRNWYIHKRLRNRVSYPPPLKTALGNVELKTCTHTPDGHKLRPCSTSAPRLSWRRSRGAETLGPVSRACWSRCSSRAAGRRTAWRRPRSKRGCCWQCPRRWKRCSLKRRLCCKCKNWRHFGREYFIILVSWQSIEQRSVNGWSVKQLSVKF